jgi:hypothetical protein
MEDDTESLLNSVKSFLSRVDSMLSEDREEWEDYLRPARSAIAVLDRIHFFELAGRVAEQRWIVQVFQDYAYHDPDEGSVQDMAEWCRTSWLRILRDYPEDVEALIGTSLQFDCNRPFS